MIYTWKMPPQNEGDFTYRMQFGGILPSQRDELVGLMEGWRVVAESLKVYKLEETKLFIFERSFKTRSSFGYWLSKLPVRVEDVTRPKSKILNKKYKATSLTLAPPPEKLRRRCGLCGKPGHNKKTCPKAEDLEWLEENGLK